MAVINAARKIKGLPPVVLSRSQAYIGVLIDDLVTKGTNEPYRMMTSRAEYRLLLRHDNADLRLTGIGYDVGLASQERYDRMEKKRSGMVEGLELLKKRMMAPSAALTALLQNLNQAAPKSSVPVSELLKRPGIVYADLRKLDDSLPSFAQDVVEQIEIELRYGGYIERQNRQVQRLLRMESHTISADFDYGAVNGLSTEAVEKLTRIHPQTLAQAGRISGVSPADVAVLMICLERIRRETKGV